MGRFEYEERKYDSQLKKSWQENEEKHRNILKLQEQLRNKEKQRDKENEKMRKEMEEIRHLLTTSNINNMQGKQSENSYSTTSNSQGRLTSLTS